MNQQTTKQKILNAARRQFIEFGFAGASIGNIAKLAEVTRSLVFHHFGNKENLWVAVKQTIVQDAQQQTKTVPDFNLSFDEFLQELFNTNINFYRNNPDIIRMMNWQRLEHQDQQEIGVTLSPEANAWLDAFKHYQNTGDINKKLKPEFIMALILSIISSTALDPSTFIRDETDLTNYITFCIDGLHKLLGSSS